MPLSQVASIRIQDRVFGERSTELQLFEKPDKNRLSFIFGENGSGKSTITQCLVQKQRGQIFGDSADISELAEDLEFPTPSAAAVFVLGGSQNGWTEWVNNDGETLNQVYRSED